MSETEFDTIQALKLEICIVLIFTRLYKRIYEAENICYYLFNIEFANKSFNYIYSTNNVPITYQLCVLY